MGLSGLGSVQKIVAPESATVTSAPERQNTEPLQKSTAPQKEAKKSLQEPQVQSKDRLERIAKAMENYVQSIQRDLRIKIDDKTDQVVIQVISKSEGKVIRQIPPQELLNLAAKMEEMTGLLFNKSA